MFDSQNRFVIRDYQKKPPFSGFLPGIAGPMGVPLWCYYNNRGQAVCSFGTRDKDHSIMEFSSAHASYQSVRYTGFRTFVKVDGAYREFFTKNCHMHIGMSEVEICTEDDGLAASALYFAVPGERTAALARVLTVTNTGEHPVTLELLDGMSAIVPYGLNQDFLKNMSNLARAWMQVEDAEKGRAYFRVRASLEDSAVVREVKGGTFCLGWGDTPTLLRPLVRTSLVFGEDTSLTVAEGFRAGALAELCTEGQVAVNQFPCCFLPREAVLRPGESVKIRSMYGQAEDKGRVECLAERVAPDTWFDAKRAEAAALAADLCAPIYTKTGDGAFDAYCRQTYLDNLLRGGTPVFFRHGGRAVPFYLYSRKHGDPEREYNYFSLGGEYYAQGNGNYRDVNQNRRCDVMFTPEIGGENIRTFFDLIQTDGYNPLVITPCTFTLAPEMREAFAARFPSLCPLLSGEFTPGALAMAAEDEGLSPMEVQRFVAEVICSADSEPNADFGEGYWCDHWTYDLDLVESYLAVYPEKKDLLLFEEEKYRWYETRVAVNPRAKRYCMTENGLRQYHALDEGAKRATHKWMKTADGQDGRSTLIEKLLLLCAIKSATLDAAGMGVEMEGGRPGWYDALNGLPGLLGSSMAESCELARLLCFTARSLEMRGGEIALYAEIARLVEEVSGIFAAETDLYRRWDALNTVKERYRRETLMGFSGERTTVSCSAAAKALRIMEGKVREGIDRAKKLNGGLIPTYFTYAADEVTETAEGPVPLKLTPTALPLFLEGPVRYLKLVLSPEETREVYEKVRESGLYDRKLKMYKVNESLASVSYEAGRALAFTPGWLENESVWLHMEYKYLLALLKSGLYTECAESLHSAAVPFLSPDIYGRSILENSSFIASSANPDPAVHGRGFVARLSGSTAEFLHMWQIMFFGESPLRMCGDELTLSFDPFIPDYLMPEDGVVEAVFLGKTRVIYHAAGLPALIPGKTKAARYRVAYRDGWEQEVAAPCLPHRDAVAAREGKIARIDVFMV